MLSATALRVLAIVLVVIVGVAVAVRVVVSADAERRARLRDTCAALVQYALLFGFAAVAAAISAHGLIGFARASMGLRGVWPFLLWAALDGAAGLCAVLLMRRAARGESAVAPRLAVWGLVAASAGFNWAHAPRHPGAREAFALMPVIAAMLFEFSLRETRRIAQRGGPRLAGLRWLHPVERIQVQLELAADQELTVEVATRRVRVREAAWSLHRLRTVLGDGGTTRRRGSSGSRTVRRAEHRAQVRLTRAGFSDAAVACEVLRLAGILSQTSVLAGLDHPLPDAVGAGLARDAQPGRLTAGRNPDLARRTRPAADVAVNGRSMSASGPTGDGLLIETASDVVIKAQRQGVRLSQAGLARELRARGLSIANERLHWLAGQTGLNNHPEQP